MTRLENRGTATLSQLLVRSAERCPNRHAIEDPVRGAAITYRELNGRSNDITDALLRHDVSPGDRVGICGPKSISVVSAIFGILKAHAAYVPVDSTAPPLRNTGIFEDCGIKAAVVWKPLVEGLRAGWPGQPPAILEDLDADFVLIGRTDAHQSARRPATQPAFDEEHHLAYLLYTSGSTGKPKGVIHTHRSALSFIEWCAEVFEPTESDRFSSHAPFHFDLSILDLYVAIAHGATVVLIDEGIGKQPVPLAATIADQRITVWYSTPAILRLLVEYGRLDRVDCAALRLVLFAGEVFPVKHLRALKQLWRRPRYFNLYGPTETNVCTYYEVPSEIPPDRTEPFPIGSPCSGDRTMVINDQQREVRSGEEGELCVTGASVMQGYWNLPERSAEAFFTTSDGHSWYRTGDIVRETTADGYTFIGRRDRMVKRRGYRVELGEIEAALYRHPQIAEAAVTASPDEENGVLIRAFLSLAHGSPPSLVEMKRFCSEHLPLYMIPDRFMFPDSLPKTSTDKIDYQRLEASTQPASRNSGAIAE